MKKLFLILCVVIMFFGIVGCPEPGKTSSNNTPGVSTAVVSGDSGGGSTAAGPSPVPEPTTLILLGAGLVGLAGIGRKKFFKKD